MMSHFMRRIWATQTSLAVLLAFMTAPFLHLHAAEKHGREGQPVHEHETVIHAHLSGADVAPTETRHHEAGLSHFNHDAKPLSVFAVVPNGTPLLALPFLVPARIELVPATVSIERSILQSAPRINDPPPLDLTSPRAPPA